MVSGERIKFLKEKYVVETEAPQPACGSRPSTSATFRAKLAKEEFASLDTQNLFEVFERSVLLHGGKACLGHRDNGGPYVWESYQSVYDRVQHIAAALAHRGVQPHGRVGIYSLNCPEWMIAMQACNRMSYYTVPLYDTFGKTAVQYIVNHSECTVVFVSSANWAKLVASLPGLQNVHTVVYWGSGSVDTKGLSVQVYSFQELLEIGRAHPAPGIPAKPSDLCTIMYTSGTTGNPKGVMLTHSNVMHCIAAQARLPEIADGMDLPGSHDVFLSWLPLAHIMDRAAEEAMLYYGGRIGYWSGSPEMLLDDLQALRPTVFIGPPRFWDRVFVSAMAKIRSSNQLRQFIFNYAYEWKLSRLKDGADWKQAAPLLDKYVFSKIGAALGGRLRCIFSGSAPLAPHVEEFLRVAMPFFFAQGYGLTETCAVSFFASSNTWESFGTVGIPCTILEWRLESVPDMNYDAQGPIRQGEICKRGPCTFEGYFKDPEKTAEVLDADGWFHTGDIGELDEVGSLRIIDRKKQIFKLSQGEYVSPSKVEGVYEHLPVVEQIFVHGYGTESRLVAVVVPNPGHFAAGAAAAGAGSCSYAALLASAEAKAWLLRELQARGREAGLQGFEQVKGLILEAEPFSIANELMTPTMKLKRSQLLDKYKPQIDQLYAQLRASG